MQRPILFACTLTLQACISAFVSVAKTFCVGFSYVSASAMPGMPCAAVLSAETETEMATAHHPMYRIPHVAIQGSTHKKDPYVRRATALELCIASLPPSLSLPQIGALFMMWNSVF